MNIRLFTPFYSNLLLFTPLKKITKYEKDYLHYHVYGTARFL